MLGLYRLVLASYVIITHASTTGAGDGFSLGGGVSVFSFYTLSGYLITSTLDANYAGIRGTLYFFINRALRIYPTYWLCLLIAIGIVIGLGEASATLNSVLLMPEGSTWLPNLFIFGLMGAPQRLFPPAWSLHIEMVYYILMGLALSRQKILTLAWLFVSICVLFYGVGSGLSWGQLYFSLAYPSLCFAIGASICKFRDNLSALVQRKIARVIVAFGFFYPIVPSLILRLGGNMNSGLLPIVVLYITPFLTSAVILGLGQIGKSGTWLATADSFLGDMSYPAFLLHWPVIAALSVWVLDQPELGMSLVLYSVITTFCISALAVVVIDTPTRHIRAAIRNRSRSAGAHSDAIPTRATVM